MCIQNHHSVFHSSVIYKMISTLGQNPATWQSYLSHMLGSLMDQSVDWLGEAPSLPVPEHLQCLKQGDQLEGNMPEVFLDGYSKTFPNHE